MTLIVLDNPKFAGNVGGAVRACSCWGAEDLVTTLASNGSLRVDPSTMPRLPREERMKDSNVWQLYGLGWREVKKSLGDLVPIGVEIVPGSIPLPLFEHPDEAAYLFGPEDGTLSRPFREMAHMFVELPSKHCLNLAVAVNLVLYDRQVKAA